MEECLRGILYISESCLSGQTVVNDVAKLIDASRRKNAAMDITGALVFTGERFAQYIEGPVLAIASLLTCLECDERHRQMVVHFDHRYQERKFMGWSLAYHGPSLYIARHVEGIVSSSGHAREQHVNRMLRLLKGLSDETIDNEHSTNSGTSAEQSS